MDKTLRKELECFAARIRLEALKEFMTLGFGHIGGSMSVVELLAVLYGHVMRIDPENPRWRQRDFLVCSKGHAGPAVYAALALKGYFPLEELKTLNANGTNLPSHCDMNKTVGIDMTTGSLGQGTSTAMGIATGNRLDGLDSYTYLIVGDGELNEGQCWESFMYAAHQKLDHLICFVDDNKKQLDGWTCDINDPHSFVQKFAAFGFHAQEVDGASVGAIYEAIKCARQVQDRPSVIVLDTIKGQGLKFVEETMANHSIKLGPAEMEAAAACVSALENKIAEMKGEGHGASV
ncbi:MAG: transketolase [Verrucomicrobiota bacterium]|jgi:transketolase|nr:transketolase [Verrucomicrobiota bacterium]